MPGMGSPLLREVKESSYGLWPSLGTQSAEKIAHLGPNSHFLQQSLSSGPLGKQNLRLLSVTLVETIGAALSILGWELGSLPASGAGLAIRSGLSLVLVTFCFRTRTEQHLLGQRGEAKKCFLSR